MLELLLQDAASISGLLVTTEAMIADKPEEKDAALVECLVEWVVWAAWVEWVEWECNTPTLKQKFLKKGSFYCPLGVFFFFNFQ